jgi:hypothetical protein
LADTAEQRMWYEPSQLDDLIFFDIPEPLLGRLAERPGSVRAIAPIAFLRGVERPIPTIIRSAMKHLTVSPTLSPKPSMSTRKCSGCTAILGTTTQGWWPTAK